MLRNKNVMKAVSLLVAIVLWAYVIAIENPPTTKRFEDVPVKLLSVETLNQRDLAILAGMDSTVSVTVSGKRADITKLSKDEIIATANVFGLTKLGEHYVPVEVDVLTSLASVVEVRSEKILVEIDNLVSVYKPVNIFFAGSFSEGTEAGRVTIQPEQIEVKGAKTLVESVAYVGVDVPVEQINKTGTTLLLEAVALNSQGMPVSNVKLSSTEVEVGVAVLNTKTVPLLTEIVGQIDDQHEITNIDVPDEITLRGSKSELDKIDSVSSVPIDISGITATSELPIQIELPEGVEVANRSQGISVKIDIKGISAIEFEYESAEIMFDGLADDCNAYVNTPSVKLKAVGKEAILNGTVKEDFTLAVDLAGMDPGIYTVPVEVVYEKTMSSIEIIPEEVHITINKAM